jgi:WD40 repeat protein
MPPAKRQPLSKEEIELLRQWIAAGAAGTAPTAALLGPRAVEQLVRTDLDNLEPRKRRFVRYLSLAHLPSEVVREVHRQALAKLVNSLSWRPRLVLPTPVDAGRTVYRIDLRDYRWTARQWDRIAAVTPYRLIDQPGTTPVWLRADWFVATASRPPFYHDFLQLPETDRALERQLQVDVPADLQDDAALRAGFNGSGVARNNRVLERHDALHGAYWRSYDFSDNTGRQNVFDHPLGGIGGANGFQPAGGEIIFQLPNGLFGFLLVDGSGRRVDKAPGDIVSDPKRPDRLVETGVSCFSCHHSGLIAKDDQVRAHVLKNLAVFSTGDRELILALYPPTGRFRSRLGEDNERFLRALKQLNVTAGEPEPISAVVERYEGTLDGPTAAAEMGLSTEELTTRLRRAPELSRSLGPLLARGGTIQRQVIEEAFPELVRAFVLGGERAVAAAKTGDLEGHHGAVRDAAFSPDGRKAASGGEDHSVLIWDLSERHLLQRLEGHTDEVLAVAFAPDGKHLASASRDRSVRLWDMETSRQVQLLRGHTETVRAVAWSADGRHIVSAGEDRTLRLWDSDTGKELRCLTGHTAAVTCVALGADGRLAISGSDDRTVRLWDLPSGRQREVWRGHEGAVRSVALTPDGRAISGSTDGTARLWEVSTGRELRRLSGHLNTIVRVAYVAGAQEVLTACSQYRTLDRTIRRWNARTWAELPLPLQPGEGAIECVAVSRDGTRALLGGADRLRVIDLARR